jgi:hypothetical protein
LGLLPNGARILAAILSNSLEQGFIRGQGFYSTNPVRTESWGMADACPLYFAITFIRGTRKSFKNQTRFKKNQAMWYKKH